LVRNQPTHQASSSTTIVRLIHRREFQQAKVIIDPLSNCITIMFPRNQNANNRQAAQPRRALRVRSKM
jgi:hypothetical protein